ncbi:MAG: hypothetical protein ABID54_07085 [Pseudomonadota bacterium]
MPRLARLDAPGVLHAYPDVDLVVIGIGPRQGGVVYAVIRGEAISKSRNYLLIK